MTPSSESPRQVYSVKLETSDLDILRAIAAKTGVLMSEQIRRAVKLWIAKQQQRAK